jgi:hypothetical protein
MHRCLRQVLTWARYSAEGHRTAQIKIRRTLHNFSRAAAGGTAIQPNPLRQRLATAYLRQLSAEADSTAEPGVTRVRIRLRPLQAPHFA